MHLILNNKSTNVFFLLCHVVILPLYQLFGVNPDCNYHVMWSGRRTKTASSLPPLTSASGQLSLASTAIYSALSNKGVGELPNRTID